MTEHSHERMQGAVEFPLPSQSRSEGNGVMDVCGNAFQNRVSQI